MCENKNLNFILIQRLIMVMPNSQPAIICSKLTIETLEQGVKYIQT